MLADRTLSAILMAMINLSPLAFVFTAPLMAIVDVSCGLKWITPIITLTPQQITFCSVFVVSEEPQKSLEVIVVRKIAMLQLSNVSLERDMETPYAETAVSVRWAVLFPIKE